MLNMKVAGLLKSTRSLVLSTGMMFGLATAADAPAPAANATPATVAAGIKVVSDKNPDASSVETVLKSILKPDMTAQQKSEAIFYYLVKHLYHHLVMEEPNADGLKKRPASGESTKLMDSTRNLNVYGHAICGSQSWVVNEFFNAAGLKGRIGGVKDHTVPEVFYDDKWHLFDVDQMGFVRRKDGTVPSVDEIAKDKTLLFDKHDKTPDIYFQKAGDAAGEWRALQLGEKSCYYGRKVNAHSMNLTLREGEAFTRYFNRQWAPNYRYYASFPGSEYLGRIKQEKDGPSRDLTYYLFLEGGVSRFGNWELVYEPPLAKASSMSGIYTSNNVVHSDAAPFLAPAKADAPSEVIYNFYSPYGCAGNPHNLDTLDDDTDGAILEGEFANEKGTVSYSLDLGKSWNEVHKTGGKFKVDITPKLESHYGWLVKLSFDGAGSGVKAFKSYTSGQLSPASLPFVDGKTKMTFSRANTDCVLLDPDLTAGEAELKRLSTAQENYLSFVESVGQHHSFVAGSKGSVTYKVEVPGDVVQVQTGAMFSGRGQSVLNCISFSIDEGKTWVLACKQPTMRNEPDHPEDYWGQCVDGVLDFKAGKAYSLGCIPDKKSVRESKFEPKSSKSILVKFHTEGGDSKLIRLFGIFVHYQKDGNGLPLTITHKWKGGEHVEQIGATETEKTYEVNGGPLKDNESIKIEGCSK